MCKKFNERLLRAIFILLGVFEFTGQIGCFLLIVNVYDCLGYILLFKDVCYSLGLMLLYGNACCYLGMYEYIVKVCCWERLMLMGMYAVI